MSKTSDGSLQVLGENLNHAILSHRQEATAHFVLVLIDADADIYYFADEFISQGLKGGHVAADKLIERVRQHLLTLGASIKNPGSVPIIVKAYANLQRLGNHFAKGNKVASPQDVTAFWAGFSQRNPYIDFVDVGSGKEAADNKIRGKKIPFYLDIVKNKS